jgi:small-conductance mechanosensitive channel
MQPNSATLWFFPLFGILAFGRLEGQATSAAAPAAPAAASTNAAPVTPPPAAVPLANVVTESLSDSNRLQEIQSELASDQTAATAAENLPALRQEIDRREAEDATLLGSSPTLSTLRTARTSWQMLATVLDASKDALTRRISDLDATITELGQMKAKWDATLASATTSAAPPEILARIKTVIAAIGQGTKAAASARSKVLSTQNLVAGQDARIEAARSSLKKAQASATTLLFTRDSEPLWNLAAGASVSAAKSKASQYSSEIPELRDYVTQKRTTLCLHLLIYVALALLLFWVRKAVRAGLTDDPGRPSSIEVFEAPLAMAALLALLLSDWLYPLAPRLFTAGLGMLALIPAVVILRRLIEAALFPILYAMVASCLVDQLRMIAADTPGPARLLFLGQLLAGSGFLLWLLLSRQLYRGSESSLLLERVLRIYSRIALAILFVAAAANVLGYTHLAYVMGNGMLEGSYLAVILYAVVRVFDGLILGVLRVRPISLLRMVRRHAALLARNLSTLVRLVAFFIWLWETLEIFSVRTPAWNGLSSVLGYAVNFGMVQFSIGPILRFGITIWVTLLLSRLIRFVLEEEVYPVLKLGRGVPYAASTLVHYVVLIVGVFVALAAMGIDLSKYSVLAGALGVGLGFGLQNIMNNFVSGIILLFERPIKVGDMIQVDTNLGTVQSIGIRASVIRVANGSEIIMPNGNLISNQVTNWSFSNRQRMIQIPVAVGGQADPQKVIALLVETAQAHPLVLKDPAPQVLMTTFTAAALNFEVRAWTNSQDLWMQIQSELFLSISAALRRENIALV